MFSLPFLIAEEASCSPVSVGDAALDSFLGESFLKHSLSILSGLPGSGKTQFAYSLMCWCIRHKRKVLYIQCGCSFVLDRIIEMLQCQGETDLACLESLYIENVRTAHALFDVAEKVASMFTPFQWGCVVIDSITPIFLPLFSLENANGRSLLTHTLLYFRYICTKYKLPVLVKVLIVYDRR